MKSDNGDLGQETVRLRRRAEEQLKENKAKKNLPETRAELQGLVYELDVHQIELEMQNEELRQAQVLLEAEREKYNDLFDFAPIGYFTFDRDGVIRAVNLTGAVLLGMERARLTGTRFNHFVCAADRPRLNAFLKKVFANGAKESCEVALSKGDASSLLVRIEAVVSENGRECRLVVSDITERKRLEDELRFYAEGIAAANTELKSFVNTIAHDFRSPMVNLKGFSAELGYTLTELKKIVRESQSLLPQELQAKVDELLDIDVPDSQKFINSSVDRLSGMIDALLNLARMGRRDMIYKEVSLKKLVITILQSYRHQIDEQNIQTVVGVLPKVRTDQLAMEQILSNLVDNAIKYLDPGRQGTIEIDCSENDHEYAVSIKDNGRGIAAIDREMIFEPFRRAGKQDQRGEGLGLAYVRILISKLGGRISCESEVRVGTKMSFTIPKKSV
ncbi:MAG: ATP-binding protein [Negativicutes bacterium]|nr:ATP-binding protein [Negativicutes bacterium]